MVCCGRTEDPFKDNTMPTATEAKKQRAASLKARANCQASSEGEKRTAKKLLEKEDLTKATLPDKIRMWTAESTLRQTDGTRLVHHKGLVWFLSHVKEGQLIDGRTIPLSKCFGSGDLYAILYWLGELNLVDKFGSKYRIGNTRKIVSAWNEKIESLKIGV